MTRYLPALVYLLVAIVAMIAGGNRPAIWVSSGLAVALLGLAYAMLPQGRRRGAPPKLLIEGILYFAFLAFAILQVVPVVSTSVPGLEGLQSPQISLSRGDSLLSLITFASYGVLFAVMTGSLRAKEAQRGLAILFVVGAAQAIYALVNLRLLGDTILGAPKTAYQGFATGTFVNRNSFADFIGCLIPVGLCLLVDAWTMPDRNRRIASIALLTVGMAFIGAALFASGSRAGVFAVAMATLATLILLMLRYRTVVRWQVVAIAVTVALVPVAVTFGPSFVNRSFFVIFDAEIRWDLYRQIWAAIMERPLTGYGGGSFQVVFPVFHAPPVAGEVIWDKAHNTYLALFFEYGLVFGSIPIVVVALIAGRCLVSVLRGNGGYVQIAAIGVTLLFALHSLVDFGLEMQGNAYLFVTLLALAVGSLRPRPVAETDPLSTA